jgi:5'-methylthioadenosine phosphorylase
VQAPRSLPSPEPSAGPARGIAEIGVLGGSGFYRFLEDVEEVTVETPYGDPSDRVAVGEVGGRKVAFLPRHGRDHSLPPHAINYRANVWAMHQLGVRRVIGPSAVGSLQAALHPGDLVIADQFIDRTSGRADTFFSGPEVVHVSAADPYCPELRSLATGIAKQRGLRFKPDGTVVVVQGPRFSTRAESRWYSRMGWDIIGMTQYPEVILARELEMCYLNLSLVTDYDAGLEGSPEIGAVQAHDVMRVLADNISRVRDLLADLIPQIPRSPACACQRSLEGARL